MPRLQPTGVPLVDELMKLPSADAAALRALQLLTFLAATAAGGALLLRLLGRAVRRRIAADGGARFRLWPRALAAAVRPCKVMLPLYCAARAATVALALAQVAVTRLDGHLAVLLARESGHARVCL